MKIPVSLQYALTRNNNRYLVKNLNGQVFTADPSNVFGRNTASDIGMLRKNSKFLVTSKDNSKTLVSSKVTRGRITKRRGKKSGVSSAKVTVSVAEFGSIKSMGKKRCLYQLWKVNRSKKAQRRARRIAARAEETN